MTLESHPGGKGANTHAAENQNNLKTVQVIMKFMAFLGYNPWGSGSPNVNDAAINGAQQPPKSAGKKGVVISLIDPYGDHPMDGYGSLLKIAKKFRETVPDNFIYIFAHSGDNKLMDQHIGRGNTEREIFTHQIEDFVLREHYPEYDEVIKNRIPTTIIFIGCNTDFVAKTFSKKYDFITTIGTTGYLTTEISLKGNDSWISYVSSDYRVKPIAPADRGWNVYKNGEVVRQFSTPYGAFAKLLFKNLRK